MVEVEKRLTPNQIILNLSDAERYAIRETVLSFSDFAERQNKTIEEFSPKEKPFFGGSITHSPEIFSLWVRNVELTDKMSETEREDAISFNMGALLRNMFILALITDKMDESLVTPELLIEYIRDETDFNPIED